MNAIEGEAGDFKVSLLRRPRYIKEDLCTGCTTCVEYCPVLYPDAFNQEISQNKAVHIYFSQAIPLVAYIDESCLYLKEKKCRICEGVCENKAIDFRQMPEKLEIRWGPSCCPSAWSLLIPERGRNTTTARYANVVTSMDYERLLSSTGAYGGEILRASDLKHPRKVAWIQCVGSRPVDRRRQQLLFRRLLHLHPEASDPDQRPSPGSGVHRIP